MALTKELGSKWSAALRSGQYEQGQSCLKQIGLDGKTRYCCLGILLEVQGKQAPTLGLATLWAHEQQDLAYVESQYTNSTGLYADMRNTIGTLEVNHLIKMNDKGKSFAEIADEVDKLIATEDTPDA